MRLTGYLVWASQIKDCHNVFFLFYNSVIFIKMANILIFLLVIFKKSMNEWLLQLYDPCQSHTLKTKGHSFVMLHCSSSKLLYIEL